MVCVEWHGVVWCDVCRMVWHGVVWCGVMCVEWYGMVWVWCVWDGMA